MTTDVSAVEAQTQQLREQASRAARQKQIPKENFDVQLRAQLAASNTNLKNAAVAQGTKLSGASVLSQAVKSRSSYKASGKVSVGRRQRKKNKNKSSKGGIGGTSSGLTASGPNTVASPNPTVVTSTGATSGTSSSSGSSSLGGVNSNSSDTSSGQLLQATQQMQEMDQDFNLQYLQLQEGMQAENRQYSAVSNVMKTKQDTAKNSLSNLK